MAWDPELTFFAIGASRAYGERVAQHLDLVLSKHEERAFEELLDLTSGAEAARGAERSLVD